MLTTTSNKWLVVTALPIPCPGPGLVLVESGMVAVVGLLDHHQHNPLPRRSSDPETAGTCSGGQNQGQQFATVKAPSELWHEHQQGCHLPGHLK